MTPGRRHYPWSGWPPASQQRFFRMTLLGAAGFFFSVFVGSYLFTGAMKQDIVAEKEQYARVVPLVQEVRTIQANQGALAHLAPIEAVRRIVEDRRMDDYVESLRVTILKDNVEGAQATFSGLTLIMLTDFLEDLRYKANLQTPDFTLTRNSEDSRLADMHLVVAR